MISLLLNAESAGLETEGARLDAEGSGLDTSASFGQRAVKLYKRHLYCNKSCQNTAETFGAICGLLSQLEGEVTSAF
jgi:hypothetical protein